MAQYRQEVRRVLELLSALVQPYDPDGLDLYFSTSNTRLRPKSNKEMLDCFDQRPFYGIPDFRDRFSTIIQRFQDQLGKKNLFSKVRHPKSTPSKGPRRLSLYVLTDGVWQPKGELVEEMRTLVDQLKGMGFLINTSAFNLFVLGVIGRANSGFGRLMKDHNTRSRAVS